MVILIFQAITDW
jgi:hypothetical protein